MRGAVAGIGTTRVNGTVGEYMTWAHGTHLASQLMAQAATSHRGGRYG